MYPLLENKLSKLESTCEAARLAAGVVAVHERLFWNEDGILRLLLECLAVRKLAALGDNMSLSRCQGNPQMIKQRLS